MPERPGTPTLPECDQLFAKFFDRWYDDDDRARKQFKATRPDAETCAAPGTTAVGASDLSEEGRRKVIEQLDVMVRVATEDWREFLGSSGRMDIHWIDAFDKYWDRDRVRALIAGADPAEFSNGYLVTCCEFGAALGEVLIAGSPRCEWLADWPYWESAVYDPASGYRVNVFHWAIKKFSEEGVDDGFAAKLNFTGSLIANGWKRP